MRILIINSVCGIRSTGRICTDLADELSSKGHEVKIAYGRESVPDKYKHYAVRIGSDFSTKLHGLKARLWDAAGFGSVGATKRFIKWVKEYDPDVIHLHNLHGYYINIEILFNYIKSANKKVVWTLHDCWSFTGHCSHFATVNCEKWQTECFACPKFKQYPKSLVDRSSANYRRKKSVFTGVGDMTIVTPSIWLADLVKRSFLGEYETKVINNGIDISVFKPTESDFREKYGLENKKIVLGVASAWGKNKGLYDYFKLASLLGEEYKIVLVGLTTKQFKELPENVLGITRTNSTVELAQIYTAADVFVNLTYSDTYPTVNLEAQACGTPVITYRTGGSPESIAPEGVVPQGDIQGVKNMILAGNLKLAINNNFDKKDMLIKYADIYQEK